MLQAKAVEPVGNLGVVRRRRVLELGDHRLAAAGIAGDPVDAERLVGGQQAGLHQRPHQGDKAGRPAAGVGDPLAGLDPRALALRHLRQAVDPAGRGAVRGRGVDHADAIAFHQAHRLAGRGVGQAEDHRVGVVDQLAPGLRVLAAGLGDGDELQVAAAGQPLPNLQAGGAGLAIDEHLRGHESASNEKGKTKRALRSDRSALAERNSVADQRFENWKLRRALARPYFLRSTTRLSRVRKPCGLSAARRPGS